MIDIHHHLLPGIDDGAADEETAIAMARLAVADGITHVVCTPHSNANYSYDRHDMQLRVAALQRKLHRESILLTLGLGCDFHINYENVQAALANPRHFTINASRYLLVELPDFGIPPSIGETFLELQQVGLRLILTHPERNPTLAADPQRMLPWLRNGMLVQVTADSVTGERGRHAHKAAHHLLACRWVHFVASDAHNTTVRPPRMKQARTVIERRYGEGYAAELCDENSRAVFFGEPLGVQAEMTEPSAQKSWLARLLRS